MGEEKRTNPGDSNRITREYMDSLLLEMRHLDGKLPVTEMELYGETFATPVMTAALSHLNNVHETGMAGLAEGAHLAGAVNWPAWVMKKSWKESRPLGRGQLRLSSPMKTTIILSAGSDMQKNVVSWRWEWTWIMLFPGREPMITSVACR